MPDNTFLSDSNMEMEQMHTPIKGFECITEYDEEKVMNQFREEGREEGEEKKTKEVVINMLKDQLPIPTIMRCAVVSEETVRSIAQSMGIAIA